MGNDIRFEVVTQEGAFFALSDAWQALAERTGAQFHEGFTLCERAWLHVAKPEGRSLAIVVGYRGDALVLVWPLVVHTRLALRVIRPLGPGMADYTPFLVDPTLGDAAVCQAAYRALLRSMRPDLAYFTYLPERV